MQIVYKIERQNDDLGLRAHHGKKKKNISKMSPLLKVLFCPLFHLLLLLSLQFSLLTGIWVI